MRLSSGARHSGLVAGVVRCMAHRTLSRRRARHSTAWELAFALRAFAVVVVSRFRACFDAVVRSQVEHAQQAAVVASWSFEVAGDAPRMAWHRRESCDAGQRPHRGLQPACQTGQTRRLRVPKSRQLRPPDTIPLHPQTAGRNPDFMLIARSKSKSPYAKRCRVGWHMTWGTRAYPIGSGNSSAARAQRSTGSSGAAIDGRQGNTR